MRRQWGWMALCLLGASAAAAEGLRIADFDGTVPETFSFKDDKGSLLQASGAYADPVKGKVGGVKFDIVAGGYGGWGLALKGTNASGHRYVAFDLRGEKGGETFDIGLRDSKGQERKKSSSLYADTTVKWQRVYVPLADFTGVTVASLDNISFSFAAKKKGRVFIDNVAFEGNLETAGAVSAGDLANKVVVDGFDRTAPESAYRTFTGDGSQINLTSSRILYDGDYSMEVQYRLVTDRPWGTWVSALRVPAQPLDWSGVDAIKIWVKGDGSENHFRFRFTEADGQMWETTNKKALSDTRWALVTMPVSDFKLVGQPPRGAPPKLAGIKSYEIAVVSPAGSSTAGGKTSVGRIWLDLLFVTGERLRGSGIVPAAAPAPGAPAPRPSGLAGGNVDFSLIAYTEYFFTPELQSQVNSNVKLITTGKLGNFSARVEFGSESQEYGQASAYVGSTTTATENRFANVQVPSYQVFATNLHPSLSLITLGNQFIDYGLDVMAPVFGFKGILGEGDVERLNYNAFALKHSQNSYSLGGRAIYYLPQWQFKADGVYWEQTGKQTSASQIVNGQLQPTEDASALELERLAQDMVYNVSALGRFFDERLRLESRYGYNSYTQYAEGDYSDPFNPVFSQFINPAYKAGGHLWRSSIQSLGFLNRGLELLYGYRDIGTGYKPHYRQNPEYYDDTDSDQFGHTFRVIQRKSGWVASAEHDTMRRHSNSAYYRKKMLWGVGHYGYRGVDISVNQDYRREEYRFTSDRSAFTTDKNEKVVGTEIYVRAQLTPRIAGWVKPRQERIWHPATNGNFTADSLQARLEFYIANNARLFADHKVSRFDNHANEPQGHPYDDNFTRVSFEVTF